MKNEASQTKKAYVTPKLEVREGFERNVLQSGCVIQPNLANPCGYVSPTG